MLCYIQGRMNPTRSKLKAMLRLDFSTTHPLLRILLGKGLRYSCNNADRKTGKWIGVANLNLARKIKLNFDPGDGRLFRVI